MASEDRSNILPLEAISLGAVPITTHNVAWSADAELALGADDCVWLYLPEFPSAGTTSSPVFQSDFNTLRQFYESTLRFPSMELRHPDLNRPLFDFVNEEFPEFSEIELGGGITTVNNFGSSMNHVVALEWSPPGLGRMRRCVLAVLTGSGALNIYCEGVKSDIAGSAKIRGRNIRCIHSWVVAWGVGGSLLVPRARKHEAPFSREYITSFAWCRETEDGVALLAYANDEDEIVILSVQSNHDSADEEGDAGQWRVEEVARFLTPGPHPKGNPTDPEFCPSGSSFSLRWSPWLKKSWNRTTIISYVAKNYVGFRQITVRGVTKQMETPKVDVAEDDCHGICLHLAPDAFVTWEDLIWTIEGSKVCRGIIATPIKAVSFEAGFDGSISDKTNLGPHLVDVCDTTYPPDDEVEQASNPITGVIVHPPNLTQSTSSPYFSLVRLSATSTNSDWYETNLPLPSHPEDGSTKPQWATEISNLLSETEPFSSAYRFFNPNSGIERAMDGSDDGDEDLDMDSNNDLGEDDSDEDFDKAEFFERMHKLSEMEQIPTNRARIWGMAASPGGGMTAVFVSIHSTIKPDRTQFNNGLNCKVFFGRNLAPVDEAVQSMKKLSTEAAMWEWMYGSGPPVPGAGSRGQTASSYSGRKAVREKFKPIAVEQTCVLCRGKLDVRGHGNSSGCVKGHSFENCAATGIPILAPGISNTCAVCGYKCLKPDYLTQMAGFLAEFITKEISNELCGGCGGKFIG